MLVNDLEARLDCLTMCPEMEFVVDSEPTTKAGRFELRADAEFNRRTGTPSPAERDVFVAPFAGYCVLEPLGVDLG